MESYNEKQANLKMAITEKFNLAFQRFEKKRQEIIEAKEIEGRIFDEQKKQLQTKLDEIIEQKNRMKQRGFSDLSDEIMQAKAKIREIHFEQADLKMAFMDKIREFAKAQNDLLCEYRAEKMQIEREKHERQLQIEKEERERKESLSLADEETEN